RLLRSLGVKNGSRLAPPHDVAQIHSQAFFLLLSHRLWVRFLDLLRQRGHGGGSRGQNKISARENKPSHPDRRDLSLNHSVWLGGHNNRRNIVWSRGFSRW